MGLFENAPNKPLFEPAEPIVEKEEPLASKAASQSQSRPSTAAPKSNSRQSAKQQQAPQYHSLA